MESVAREPAKGPNAVNILTVATTKCASMDTVCHANVTTLEANICVTTESHMAIAQTFVHASRDDANTCIRNVLRAPAMTIVEGWTLAFARTDNVKKANVTIAATAVLRRCANMECASHVNVMLTRNHTSATTTSTEVANPTIANVETMGNARILLPNATTASMTRIAKDSATWAYVRMESAP